MAGNGSSGCVLVPDVDFQLVDGGSEKEQDHRYALPDTSVADD